MAPRRSTPIWPSRPWSRSASQNGLPLKRLRGAEELHQGDRQGRAEGDVQDGHLHLPVLLRRADLRRGRPVLGVRREVLHRHRHAPSRASAWRRSPRRPCAATATPMATIRSIATCSMSAASYAFRLRGEDHAWTPESVANLQHAVRGNLPDDYAAFAAGDQRAERAAADHARPDAVQARRDSRSRSTRSSRPPRSSSASPPAR